LFERTALPNTASRSMNFRDMPLQGALAGESISMVVVAAVLPLPIASFIGAPSIGTVNWSTLAFRVEFIWIVRAQRPPINFGVIGDVQRVMSMVCPSSRVCLLIRRMELIFGHIIRKLVTRGTANAAKAIGDISRALSNARNIV